MSTKILLEKYEGIARHIEGTDMCMLTLPCKWTDKKVTFTVEQIDSSSSSSSTSSSS